MAFRTEIQIRQNDGSLRRLNDLIDGRIQQFAEKVVVRARQYTQNFKGHQNPDKKKRPTGNLSRSLQSIRQGKYTLVIRSRCGYGAYVELGTRKMAAQPYFAPAVKDEVNAMTHGGKWV